MKFADPKNDIAFKKIFGDENKTSVLISFLNSILNFKHSKQIKSLTIVNPYQIPQLKDYKNTVLDIKAKNQDDEEFIVEMQVAKDSNFAKRSLYYSSKSYVNQIQKAEDYNNLKKVYFIGILDFIMFDNDDYLSRHLILDTKTLKQEIKDLEFNFIELKKFKLELKECDTLEKKWIYFIKNAENLTLIPQEYENINEFKMAFESAKIYEWSEKELEIYDYMSMQEGKRYNEIETARMDGHELGLEEGREQGLEEGREKGREEGREQGKLNEKIEIAKNLLDILDNEIISLKTGLDIEMVQKLRIK